MNSIEKPSAAPILPSSPFPLTSLSTDPTPFHRGEILYAQVIEKRGSREVRLEANGLTFTAQTALSLNAGDRLHLKVEKTDSLILLTLIPPDSNESTLLRNALARVRSSPEGLLQAVKSGLEIFQGDLQPVLQVINQADVDALLRILHTLVYSEKSLKNPSFLKEYFSNMGFLLESNLKKSLGGFPENDDRLKRARETNFKSLLGRLSSQLHRILESGGDSHLEPQFLELLKSLSDYADESLNTITSQQVANVLGQEEEQSYYFQIPLKLADDLRAVDLFIQLDDPAGQQRKRRESFQFVMFLDLDALGDLMIDVHHDEKRIQGTLKCVSPEAQDILSEFLETLNERLTLSGYGPNYLKVQLCGNIAKEKSEFLKGQILYSKELVNCFV